MKLKEYSLTCWSEKANFKTNCVCEFRLQTVVPSASFTLIHADTRLFFLFELHVPKQATLRFFGLKKPWFWGKKTQISISKSKSWHVTKAYYPFCFEECPMMFFSAVKIIPAYFNFSYYINFLFFSRRRVRIWVWWSWAQQLAMQDQVCTSPFLWYMKFTVFEFGNRSWRNYLLCHTWQGSQLNLDLSPDTESELQGSCLVQSLGSFFLLTGFGFPRGWNLRKQESGFFQLPLFWAVCETEYKSRKQSLSIPNEKDQKNPQLNSTVCLISVPVWYKTVFEGFLLEATNVIIL